MARPATGPISKPERRAPESDAVRALRALATPLRFLRGIGPKRAEQLQRFGLSTVEDLLYHLPFRYEDRRRITEIAAAVPGQTQSFVGRLVGLKKSYIPRRRAQMLIGALADGTGIMELVWYRAPGYLANTLGQASRLVVYGRVEEGERRSRRLVHPDFQVLAGDEEPPDLGKIVPVYERPAGLSLALLRKWIDTALAEHGARLPASLPVEAIERLQLLPLRQALRALHQPSGEADVGALNDFSSTAHRSVIFDELFYLQLGLGLRKRLQARRAAVLLNREPERLRRRMADLLPFRLTGAQQRALREIDADMKRSSAMQRLLQGDVGSGKTMVAWLASLRVIDSGYQAVWMAPTELLAEQHYRNFEPFSTRLRIASAILTGAQPARATARLLQRIRSGEIRFIVGTHALIQEGVAVPRMGLGVIDEQHRFGVAQRLSLQRLLSADGSRTMARQPHMLLMSATPIPRSLAMVLYGDLEVSFLDEMPPGRAPVHTTVFSPAERRELYARVIRELRAGYQAFIVYPLVEASEELAELRDATRMAHKMKEGVFKEFGVGLVHGRMSASERDQVMRAFRDGAIAVLVSTTVIEVGIDIPNATVMVVEHAERFGLSQLHQLRGRVGRGQAPGYCFLVNRGSGSGVAGERLRVLEREHDGFKIAEADLSLRGPGEVLGTRQSGFGNFRLVNLPRDMQLLVEARSEAQAWLDRDAELKETESSVMKQILLHRWGRRLELGSVG